MKEIVEKFIHNNCGGIVRDNGFLSSLYVCTKCNARFTDLHSNATIKKIIKYEENGFIKYKEV